MKKKKKRRMRKRTCKSQETSKRTHKILQLLVWVQMMTMNQHQKTTEEQTVKMPMKMNVRAVRGQEMFQGHVPD